MIPSLYDQVEAINNAQPAPKPVVDRVNHGMPTQADVCKVMRMMSSKRITARIVQDRIGKSISTAQNIMRLLCEEGIARRVENGPRGEKGYVKAEQPTEVI